jgi:hypothetical protein
MTLMRRLGSISPIEEGVCEPGESGPVKVLRLGYPVADLDVHL